MAIAETEGMINGALIEIDVNTGKALSISRINEPA